MAAAGRAGDGRGVARDEKGIGFTAHRAQREICGETRPRDLGVHLFARDRRRQCDGKVKLGARRVKNPRHMRSLTGIQRTLSGQRFNAGIDLLAALDHVMKGLWEAVLYDTPLMLTRCIDR